MEDAPFESILEMMKVCYARCFDASDHERQQLTTGIFWLADCLEQHVTVMKIPTLSHAIASISDLRDMANNLFKGKSQWVGTDKFNSECYRLLASDSPANFEG